MHRRAFNPVGHLGSFYDAYRDQIIAKSKLSIPVQKLFSPCQLQCNIVNGTNDGTFDILQVIGVEDELRLSSLLSLKKKRSGIALVLNYPHRISECTRFLCYSWICEEVVIDKKNVRIGNSIGINDLQSSATHVITRIKHGIDLIVVLQLPSKIEVREKIDRALRIICDELRRDMHGTFVLSSNVEELLKMILSTETYSNVPFLATSLQMSRILREINSMKKTTYRCPPITYHLETITAFFSSKIVYSIPYTPESVVLRNRIEQCILYQRNKLKLVRASLNDVVPDLLCGYLEYAVKNAEHQVSNTKKTFKKYIQRLFKLLIDVRHKSSIAVHQIEQALTDKEAAAIRDQINALTKSVNELIRKGKFISELRQRRFEYLKLEETKYHKCRDLQVLERMMIGDHPQNRVLCSNENLNRLNESKLIELRQMLIEKQMRNPTLRLIYLDFTDSKFPLSNITALPSLDTDLRQNHIARQISLPGEAIRAPVNVPPPLLRSSEKINVLLLGETGVGKSTFINAFANYLTFDSLGQARTNEPVVLIPASFIMTTGDNFEEKTIKFGEMDGSENEHFNASGQSVTQHCKSYVFYLKDYEKQLRIIDTPGFGDTRGLEQDDRNIEHILQYIDNLTHLDAICFLLKPNSTRLNIFLRTCLIQLFSFLAPAARENVIFCFTGARSTFYSPGDTAPLLKAMLADSSMKGISFQKQNTFCFDSEAFRYLVALQNDMTFTEADQQDYEMSWTTSMKESNRLVKYIDENLHRYHLKNGWQSIKHAQLEISRMVRPILEAMRNIVRNIVLQNKNLKIEFIELQPKPVHHTAAHCLSCKDKPLLVGKFWVLPAVLHEIQGDCPVCSCPPDHHVRINYMLEYHYIQNASDHHQDATNDILIALCSLSSELAHFLEATGYSAKGDLFLLGLKQILDEETELCQIEPTATLNLSVLKKLDKAREFYELSKQKITETKSRQEPINLETIYSLINRIGKYNMVHKQMEAVKQSQEIMLKNYEHDVEML